MFITFCIIIIVVILVLSSAKLPTSHEEKGIVFIDVSTIYIGGLPDIEGGKKVSLVIQNDEMKLCTYDKSKSTMNAIITINKQDLIDAEIMSESQIVEKIKLGTMLVFGVLGLGMAKSKTVYNNFLVITYEKNNEKKQLILKPSVNLEQTVKTFRNYIGVAS